MNDEIKKVEIAVRNNSNLSDDQPAEDNFGIEIYEGPK